MFVDVNMLFSLLNVIIIAYLVLDYLIHYLQHFFLDKKIARTHDRCLLFVISDKRYPPSVQQTFITNCFSVSNHYKH